MSASGSEIRGKASNASDFSSKVTITKNANGIYARNELSRRERVGTQMPENCRASRSIARKIKLLLDVVVASCLLIVVMPVFLLAWVMVSLDGGPVLYGHTRIGRNGVPFRCLKFRSMVPNADAVLQQLLDTDADCADEWNATRKLRHDPRITTIGRFLRRTSLDEIPQLLNVIKGDMSLVGPRPVVEGELQYYGQDLCYYEAVRPGITGLWQVSGRSDTSYVERVNLDSYYVRNWSLALDFSILCRTIPAVMMQKGAR